MRGDLVIVRAFRGIPLVRRVWEEVEHGVYVTDDTQFKRLLAGEKAVQPIGFPMEDVFKYDPELIGVLERPNELDWTKLTSFGMKIAN